MFTFILVIILLAILLKLWNFFSQFGREGTILGSILCGASLLGLIHAFLCANVSWYGSPVVAPEISLELKPDYISANADLEPLLGEVITEENENYYVTLTDHCLHYEYSCDNTPNIVIEVTPEAATYKKAKATLLVTRLALENKPDSASWRSVNNPDLKDQTTTLDDKFTYTIDGGDLRFNESADTEPTKYRIKVQNKRGEATKTLIITRLPVYRACELYDANHPGHSARDEVNLCRERAKYLDKKAEEKRKAEENYNKYHQDSPASTSTNTSGSASRTCQHYEAGRCWDDLEMEAYSQGQYDKLYGYYGDSYYESDNCDQTCRDILEDAYDEGYSDY